MNYYKLKPEITSLSNMSIGTSDSMAYMLHPNYYIATSRTLMAGSYETPEGWTLSVRDLVKVPEPAVKSIFYLDSNTGALIHIDFTDTYSFTGHQESAMYRGIYLSELKPFETPQPIEGVEYSEPHTITKDFIKDYAAEQLRSRYSFIPVAHIYTDNAIMDSAVPYETCRYSFKLDSLQEILNRRSRDTYAISAVTARTFNIPRIPTIDLCRVLGYEKEQLLDLATTVRNKEHSFAFVGAGGTGINTAYWLSEICNIVDLPALFYHCIAFEKEDIELSNLYRFPIDPTTGLSEDNDKLTAIKPFIARITTNHKGVYHRYLPYENSSGDLIYDSPFHKKSKDPSAGFEHNPVFYGAPDLVSRERLSPYGRFICATHADKSCSIWLNPSQDLDIQVESYGMIQLNSFFMNQLKMTITLLEILASDQDLMEPDKHLLEYSFDGKHVLEPENVDYNFRLVDEPDTYGQGEY